MRARRETKGLSGANEKVRIIAAISSFFILGLTKLLTISEISEHNSMILERMEADEGLRRMKRSSGRLNRRRFWEFDERLLATWVVFRFRFAYSVARNAENYRNCQEYYRNILRSSPI